MRKKRLSQAVIACGAAGMLTLVIASSPSAQGITTLPAITALSKTEYCAFGDLLTLNGANFGAQGDHGYVSVSVPFVDVTGSPSYRDFPLSIKDWSDTQIQARLYMPNGAAAGPWIATVHRDDGQIAAIAFATSPCSPQAEDTANAAAHQPLPVVYDFQKSEFHPGDLLIIEGEHFGLDPAGGYVTLIGAFQDSTGRRFYQEYRASVFFWSSNQIQVALNLPAGAAFGTWAATVHRGDGETATQAFVLTATPLPAVPTPPAVSAPPAPGAEDCLEAGDPVVFGFQKSSYCASGDFLIIEGEHFCNDPDGGWVSITAPIKDAQGNISYQEFRASITGWLSTQIQINFVAPPGAVPGTYTATVHVHRDDGSGNDVIKTASGSFNVVSCASGSGG